MARNRGRDGRLVVRMQRRYGRIRRGDGAVMEIETHVVRRRAEPAPTPDGFGRGFERRVAETPPAQPPPPAPESPPVMKVSDRP